MAPSTNFGTADRSPPRCRQCNGPCWRSYAARSRAVAGVSLYKRIASSSARSVAEASGSGRHSTLGFRSSGGVSCRLAPFATAAETCLRGRSSPPFDTKLYFAWSQRFRP